jgi:uncharacterized protein GlcG (DUF336 family)
MPRVSRMEIDLELAESMSSAAVTAVATTGALVSVAVVDGGGNLIHFARMDGAEIAGPTLAVDKAFTAVAHRIGTHELTELIAPLADLAGMNSAAGGRYVGFPGGLPCWDGDRVVGGIGVSGGTGEQDLAAARAGLASYDREAGR